MTSAFWDVAWAVEVAIWSSARRTRGVDGMKVCTSLELVICDGDGQCRDGMEKVGGVLVGVSCVDPSWGSKLCNPAVRDADGPEGVDSVTRL